MTVEESEGKASYEVTAWTEQGEQASGSVTEAPPAFVQRLEHPGGDVIVAPLVEALRAWLRKGREDTVSGSAQKEDASPEGGSTQ